MEIVNKTPTIRGIVTRLYPSFGFIRFEGVSYFFIPSALQRSQSATFSDVRVGAAVEFIPIEHPKGMRAIEILVLSGTVDLPDHDSQ